MSKTMCEKGLKGQKKTENPEYYCKKCGAQVSKEKEVCKAKKIKKEA